MKIEYMFINFDNKGNVDKVKTQFTVPELDNLRVDFSIKITDAEIADLKKKCLDNAYVQFLKVGK